MDRRLALEFFPGLIFFLTNAMSSLFVATGAAIIAALIAVVLRYRIDGQVPFIAVSTVVLSVLFLGIGFALDDERYIKMKPTIGGVAFAVILASGMAFKPSLLERSLGYKLDIIPTGWNLLHLAWIGLALLLALTNDLVWRNTSTDLWVVYNVVSGPVAIALYWGVTWCVAWYYWDEEEDEPSARA